MPSATTTTAELGLVRVLPIASIRPSPENDKLYRPITANDPDIAALATSIGRHGVIQPLVLSADGWILSGHRRYAAALLAGMNEVPCLTNENISRQQNPNEFLVALREHNRQREKSFDEKVREAVVATNPEHAYASLVEERRLAAGTSFTQMDLGNRKRRSEISSAKQPFLDAINRVLVEHRDFWPVSLRFIHYKLLNDPPLTHASKPDSAYRNELRFSKQLSELATRARIEGLIPEQATEDETRPVTLWNCHRDDGAFVAKSMDEFLTGYYRDLMQSQPNHVELVVEKNTAFNILRDVAGEFCIPITSTRGGSSLPPRTAIKKRFRASGKEKLILILFGDFDPDGESIATSFARTMRDDFNIPNLEATKAGLTHEQVSTMNLPSSVELKTTSASYNGFVAKYGAHQMAFELEAVEPAAINHTVDGVPGDLLKGARFNAELAKEKEDAAKIAGLRKTIRGLLTNNC